MKQVSLLILFLGLFSDGIIAQNVSTRQNGYPITINGWEEGIVPASTFQTADTFQLVISDKMISFAYQLVIHYAAGKDSTFDVRCNKEDLALYQSRLRGLKSGDTLLIDKAKGIDRDGRNVVIKTSTYYLTD